MRRLHAFAVAALWCAACPSSPATVPVETAPPQGRWVLLAFADEPPLLLPPVTLEVDADGALRGSGGCNAYFGRWEVGDGGSRIGPLGATRRLCPAPEMAVEARYLAALGRVAGWRGTPAGIDLVDSAGGTLLRLHEAGP